MIFPSIISYIHRTYFAAPLASEIYDKQRDIDGRRIAQERAEFDNVREKELCLARRNVFNLEVAVEDCRVDLAIAKVQLNVAKEREARLAKENT